MNFIKKRRLVEGVDSICDLFSLDVISLMGMEEHTKKTVLDSLDTSQLEDVCQGVLDKDYIKLVLDGYEVDVSHVVLLKVKNLVISFAVLTEKFTPKGEKYMYIDILCARKYSGTGKYMLLAAEDVALRQGVRFASLSAVFEAIGFYEKMGYRSVPIYEACGDEKMITEMPFNSIIVFYKDAKQALETGNYTEGNSVLSDKERTKNVNAVLLKLRFTQDQIVFLHKKYVYMMDEWEELFQYIELDDYFEESTLIMTKCLVNSS